jgi:hypothetical protein
MLKPGDLRQLDGERGSRLQQDAERAGRRGREDGPQSHGWRGGKARDGGSGGGAAVGDGLAE